MGPRFQDCVHHHSLRVNSGGFVCDYLWCALLSCVLQATGLCAETMRVVLERCYNDLRLLFVPNKTLKAEGFFRSNKVRLPFFTFFFFP